MIAWQQMHQEIINNNENRANEIINQYGNINENDVIHGRDILEYMRSMTMAINSLRNTYQNQMNIMRQNMEDQIGNLNREIQNLRNEITRLNNIAQINEMPPPPPPPQYTKEALCAEILESIEDTKEQMHDQTYRVLTSKLMEIFNR